MSATTPITIKRIGIDGFESLRESVPACSSDVLQMEKGPLAGSLAHVSLGDFCLSAGSFSRGILTTGALSHRNLSLGVMLDAPQPALTLCGEFYPGDIAVLSPGTEHQCRYFGPTSFAIISIDAAEFSSFLGCEAAVTDFRHWQGR